MNINYKIDLLYFSGGKEINLYGKRFDKTPLDRAKKQFLEGVEIIIGDAIPEDALVRIFESKDGGGDRNEDTKTFKFHEWAGKKAKEEPKAEEAQLAETLATVEDPSHEALAAEREKAPWDPEEQA